MYKIGDKVLVTKTDFIDDERNVKVGDVLTISQLDSVGAYFDLDHPHFTHIYKHFHEFEKLEEETNMTNIQIGDVVKVIDKGEKVEFLSMMLGEDIYEHGAELGETGIVVEKFGTPKEGGFTVDFGRVFRGNGKTTQAMKLSWIEKVEGGK